MSNWTRPSRRPTSSRSTSSSTGNRISTISFRSRPRNGSPAGGCFPPGLVRYLERDILPRYLARCRWFGGRSRKISSVRLARSIPLDGLGTQLSVISVKYRAGKNEHYLLPLSLLPEQARPVAAAHPEGVICRCRIDRRPFMVLDGAYVKRFQERIFMVISRREHIRAGKALLRGLSVAGRVPSAAPEARLLKADQSNTALVYGRRFYLKLFRKLEPGVNPDVELTRHLSGRRRFARVPAFIGSLELLPPGGGAVALGLMQSFIRGRGDAWSYATGQAAKYFARCRSCPGKVPPDLAGTALMRKVALLGRLTAGMHRALARSLRPDLRPEPLSAADMRSISRRMRARAAKVLGSLGERCPELPPATREAARKVLAAGAVIRQCFGELERIKPSFRCIRIHGDYHLGQVLLAGSGLVVIDFEGEPARPLRERRSKQPVLRDLSGMLRSFHYAAYATWLKEGARPELRPAAERWYSEVSGAFLASYFGCPGGLAGLLPADRRDRQVLLEAYILDKAVYELAYELDHRPAWVAVPLYGILDIAQRCSGRGPEGAGAV